MTTQERFEKWLGFELDLPECTVVPRFIWWPKFGERKTLSDFLQHMEDKRFSKLLNEEVLRGQLEYLWNTDEEDVELLLKTSTYSSDAVYDDDAPPYCQAVVTVKLGRLRKAMRAATENQFDWVVIEPDNVQLFTDDWEEVDFGRYGNFNELFVRGRDSRRMLLTMTHKHNPQAYLKFDNV